MQNSTLLILGLILLTLPASVIAASNYRPMYFPDLETAFKVPARGTWYSPSGNSDPDSLYVPASWYSPTTDNYTEFLKVPSWKSWNSPSTTNYTSSLNVPAWKSWKPISFPDWNSVFVIPWR